MGFWVEQLFQETGLNKACKYLLCEFLFEQLNFERIDFGASSLKNNLANVSQDLEKCKNQK